MGRTYEKQIADGVYPSYEEFKNFYIIENHSIKETAVKFGVSDTVIKNLIVYFNLHKDKTNSVITCARKRVENNNYPSRDDLLKKYIECGYSWAKVGDYYGYARITLARIRRRYGLTNVPNPILSDKNVLLKYIDDNNIKSVNELSNKLNVKTNQIYYWAEKHPIVNQICKISSYPEEEIKKLLNKSLFVKDRTIIKPLEIDLFNKEKKIGIEYDGVFRHSIIHKEKDYHFNKSLKSDANHVYLIHIFEDEWVNKDRQGLEKFLINTFSDLKYSSCGHLCVKEVPTEDEINFNINNHYDGHKDSDLCLGLYDDNVLLQLISFKKLQNNTYEVVRDYPEINNLISGGYEKILNYFCCNYQFNNLKIKCNFSKYNGALYEKIGFRFLKYTGPKKRAINPFFKNNYTVYNSGEKIYVLNKEGALHD